MQTNDANMDQHDELAAMADGAAERAGDLHHEPELRTMTADVELRAATDPDVSPGTLSGYAFLWDVPTRLSNFSEVVERSALDGVLERSDVRALMNHDANHVLGRMPNTLTLTPDEKGLRYEVELPNTQTGRDLAVLAKRGDISQSSYAFRVGADGQSWDEDTRTRRITRFSDLLDVSVVTYPAQPLTEASVRTSFVPPVQEAAVEPSEAPESTQEAPAIAEAQRTQVNPAEAPKTADASNPNFIPYVMQNSNDFKAQRSHKMAELAGLTEGATSEGRALTEQDAERVDQLNEAIADLDAKIARAEATEQNLKRMASMSAGAASSSEAKAQDKVAQRFSISKAILEASKGQLTGLEAEMSQEGSKQLRDAGRPAEGVLQIPGFINTRATSTTGGTNMPGESMSNLLEGLVPDPVVQRLGANVLQGLAGDIVLPTLGNDYTIDTGETDTLGGGAAIGGRKLTAQRIGSRIDISNALLSQMNASVDAVVASQFAKATAAKVDKLFIQDVVANCTFVNRGDTAAAVVAGMDAGTAAALHAAVGDAGSSLTRPGYISSHGALAFAKHTAVVSGGAIPVMVDGQILGFPALATSECSAGLITDTSFDTFDEVYGGTDTDAITNEANLVPMVFADFSDVFVAYWGGGATDLIIDPFTSGAAGITRMIVNAYADAKVAHTGAAKFSVGA